VHFLLDLRYYAYLSVSWSYRGERKKKKGRKEKEQSRRTSLLIAEARRAFPSLARQEKR